MTEKNKKEPSIIDFEDFGFTFADDVVEENDKIKQNSEDLEKRLENMYNIFIKFLDNLSKNPDQPTIVWPNRIQKINEFKAVLKNIKEGKE